jgi:hypothetical protein
VAEWSDTDALIRLVEEADAPHGRPVAVHVTAAATLDLAGHRKSHTPGNFRFTSMPFGTFLRRLYGRASRGASPLSPLPALSRLSSSLPISPRLIRNSRQLISAAPPASSKHTRRVGITGAKV